MNGKQTFITASFSEEEWRDIRHDLKQSVMALRNLSFLLAKKKIPVQDCMKELETLADQIEHAYLKIQDQTQTKEIK